MRHLPGVSFNGLPAHRRPLPGAPSALWSFGGHAAPATSQGRPRLDGMDPRSNTITTRSWPALGRLDLVVSGELDIASGEALEHDAEQIVGEGWDIVLDLADVTFVDCSGVHALQRVCASTEHAGHSAVVRSPSAPVRRLARLLPPGRTRRPVAA